MKNLARDMKTVSLIRVFEKVVYLIGHTDNSPDDDDSSILNKQDNDDERVYNLELCQIRKPEPSEFVDTFTSATQFYTYMKGIQTKIPPEKWQVSLVRNLDEPNTGIFHFYEKSNFVEGQISRPVVKLDFSELEDKGYVYSFESWVFPQKFPDRSPELHYVVTKDFYKVELELPKKTIGYNGTRFYL